ncbi:MAG: hypothetical protein SGARI_001559 [Bacillariaceae sp.]
MSVKTPNSAGSVNSFSTPQSQSKLNLDQFLKMKRQSEKLVEIQKHHPKRLQPSPKVHKRKGSVPLSEHTPQEVEDTWHPSHSLDSFLSNHEPLSPEKKEESKQHPFPALGQSLFQLDKKRQQQQKQPTAQVLESLDDSIIEEEEDEVGMDILSKLRSPRLHDSTQTLSTLMSSADWKDMLSPLQNSAASMNRIGSESFATLREQEMVSCSLSLSRDDACMNVCCDEDDDEAATIEDPDGESLLNSIEEISLKQDASEGANANVKEVEELFMLDASRRRKYTGYFMDYVKHGHGITQFSDGRVFEGTYSNGIIQEGKMMYPDESFFIGAFEHGVRHGRGTYSFPNGAVYFGEFLGDHFDAGTIVYPNGSRFFGQWKNGLRHGSGKEFSPKGRVIREGQWHEGRKI